MRIDHVAGIALFVADAPRDFREEIVVDAGKRANLSGNHSRHATFGRVDLDAHGVGAVAGVVAGLIDADGKAARDRRKNIAVDADDERLGGVFIANAPDERATPSLIKGQNAE